jgi:hypothetical protein
MKLSRILKCIFVPFYVCRYASTFKEEDLVTTLGFFYGAFLVLYIVARLSYGISVANDPKECRLRSIGDVIIAPMYALGCNIGKDRFDIRVN